MKIFKNTLIGLLLLSLVGCGIPSYYALSHWDKADTKARAYAVGVTILTLGINPLIGYIRVTRSGMELEESSNYIKDLEKVGAKIDSLGIQGLTQDLMNRYGLSYTSGNRIAQGIYYFQKVSQTRKLRDEEINKLYKSSLGISAKEISSAIDAYMQDDQESIDVFVDKVSREHQTTPEHIRELISENFML